MKLVKIEAHGFKSFADPISLKFTGGVAGIVGPNGSGKSNINDAIKWVLGEQSFRELRGDSMEDVIFAGSKTSPAMNKAVVSLIFDNREGLSSLEGDFIKVTRIMERGKGSTYLINDLPSRQKDIKALAMETGIGKSSLAIISQGTVSDIAEATDEQRRLIFEEAAGVSKYKFRKTEAQRKLESVSISLGKINTSVSELERQVLPLQKQAKKAIIFKQKSEELKNVEIALLAHEINRLEQEQKRLSDELSGVQETDVRYSQRIEELSVNISKDLNNQSILQTEIQKLSGEKSAIQDQIREYELIEAKEQQRQQMILSGQIKADSKDLIENLKDSLQKLQHKINYLKNEENQINEKINNTKEQIKALNNQINAIELEYNDKQNKKIKLESRLEFIKDQKESKNSLFKGTKTIVDNKNLFKGYKGLVSDLINVKAEYTLAIKTILNNATQHIVVDKSETAVNAVNFLKQNKGGRATFIPLNTIKAKSVRDDHVLVLQGQNGFVGIASDLVETDKQFNVLKEFLLGNIIVANNIDSANNIARILDRKYMVVTLDGDIIRVGGVVVGGEKDTSITDSLLGLDDKIKEIEEFLPKLNEFLQKSRTELLNLKDQRASRYEMYSELEKIIVSVVKQKNDAQTQFMENKLRLENLTQDEVVDIEAKTTTLGENLEVLTSRLRSNEVELKAKLERLKIIQMNINTYQIDKNEMEKELNSLRNQFNKQNRQFESNKFYLGEYRARLLNYYSLTLDFALENYHLDLPVSDAKEFVERLKKEIKELGSVNLDSIEQLKEVEGRYNELKAQQNEIEEAKSTIESAIAEMDKIIVSRMSNIVNDVNEEFNNVFTSMFGGGSAHIKFNDKNNILESGISIQAQPPGKSVKNLRLFSGGEKSLIAISLLFGILKARPLPLCILDEVEAALDEANVVRYAEYLQSLKNKTQFLVITHRHGTMSRMDDLFGATMQKRGITSFFSIQLSEAKKMIDDEHQSQNF
ncbi:ABC transporter ATP-binding protein [Mycoplasmopsis pullorum]|uniref:AAA family ATPase n=1 Tax=Mycoplasmopsis pullorum TaxID=48003 RepID=UPI001119D58D|nr:AAA family ATPase [Mycoplasmopsis pullorum]TNK92369.1 ABC transporter ATP-binding protein [Mycoplasmopsis pullorum]